MTEQEIDKYKEELERLCEQALAAQEDIRRSVELLAMTRIVTLGVVNRLREFPFASENREKLLRTLLSSVGQVDVALLAFGVKP